MGGDQFTETPGPRSLDRGMYVTVRIHVRPAIDLFAVPERALRPGNVAWLIREGQLHIEKVHVADVVGENVLLYRGRSSIAAGDRVAISPIAAAREGMAVREKGDQ